MTKKMLLECGLTKFEYDFCITYIKNDFDSVKAFLTLKPDCKNVAQRAHEYLKKPRVQKFIKEFQAKQAAVIEKKIAVNYEKILEKLWRIVTECVPDDNILPIKVSKVAISAISEINKMQGNYAPEKHVHAHFDFEEIKNLTDKYRREY